MLHYCRKHVGWGARKEPHWRHRAFYGTPIYALLSGRQNVLVEWRTPVFVRNDGRNELVELPSFERPSLQLRKVRPAWRPVPRIVGLVPIIARRHAQAFGRSCVQTQNLQQNIRRRPEPDTLKARNQYCRSQVCQGRFLVCQCARNKSAGARHKNVFRNG